MNKAAFFDTIRDRLYRGSMSPSQVAGCEAILDACVRHDVTDTDHVAHILAHVMRETGGYMLGIKETVMPFHMDKSPSDATVIARLDAAWEAGRLGKVSKPYWRDGAFGRGPIQITHWDNYVKFGKRLGVPLRQNPGLALDPDIGADIAVVGMKEGLFRKLKLSDFKFPEALSAAPDKNPRRIVNGKDGSDIEVAGYHRAFAAALRAAGHGKPVAKPKPVEAPPVAPPPVIKQPDDPGPPEKPASDDKPFWEKSPLMRSVGQALTWLGAGGAALLSADWKVIAVLSAVGLTIAFFAIRYQVKK